MSTHTIHAALTRASQPSLGSIVLASLILTGIRLLGLIIVGLRALPAYLPPYMRLISVGAGMLIPYLEAVTDNLSTYALIYVGLTGDPFMPSARRSRVLTGAVQNASLARYRRRFKTERESNQAFLSFLQILTASNSSSDDAHRRTSYSDVPLRSCHLPLCRAHVGCSKSSALGLPSCRCGDRTGRPVLCWIGQGYVSSQITFQNVVKLTCVQCGYVVYLLLYRQGHWC